MSTQSPQSDSPYRRDNYWGGSDIAEPDRQGHDEVDGTDPADYLAYHHLSAFAPLVCGRTLRETGQELPLSEPCMHLPKTFEQSLDGTEPPEECPECGGDLRHIAPLLLECVERECGERIEDDRPVRFVEYRQHRHRRRVNPETGWINWGESTSTAVPGVEEDVYMLAVRSYLLDNGVQRHVDDWLAYANRLFHDPNLSSKQALATLIRNKRNYDADRRNPTETATIPDA